MACRAMWIGSGFLSQKGIYVAQRHDLPNLSYIEIDALGAVNANDCSSNSEATEGELRA